MARHSTPSRLARRRITALGVSGLLALSVAIVLTPNASASSGSLPGGTSLSVDISSPTNNQLFPVNSSVPVTGTATIGAATAGASTSLVTVVDASGSTSSSSGGTVCGNADNDNTSNDVLDCEVRSAEALNQAAAAATNVTQVGAVVFGSNASAADVGPATGTQTLTTPTTDANSNTLIDMNEVFASVSRSGIGVFTKISTNSGGTNFTAAITAASAVNSSTTTSKHIIAFLSDGIANGGGATTTALAGLTKGTQIFTFAVGSGSKCGSATDTQSLQYIANSSGGTCTQVLNPNTLPSILAGVVTPQITSLTLSVDSGTPTPITATTPTLPTNGPASVSYTTATGPLSTGSHTICVTVNGTDAGGAGSQQECRTVQVDYTHVTVTGPTTSIQFGQPIPSSFTPTASGGNSVPAGTSCTAPAGPLTVAGSPYAITCTGPATVGNFAYMYLNGSLTITTEPVVVTGPNASLTFGTPVPSSFTPTVPDGFTVPTGAACTPPGGPYTVTGSPYVLTCNGPATQGNFSYTYLNGSLTIGAELVPVTGPSVSITFGSPVPSTFTPIVPAGFTVPTGASCTAGAGPFTVIGSPYPITCTGPAAAGNFTYSYTAGSLSITAQSVVVTGPNASLVYGAPVPSSFAPTVPNGFTLPNGAACTPPAGPYTVAGSPYVLTCTGPSSDGNHTYSYVNGSLTITPLGVVVTGPSASIVFGSSVPTSFAPTVPAGFTVPTGAACTPPAGPYTVAGSPYVLTCTGPATQGNYSYTYVNGSLTITPQGLTITGPSVSYPFGSTIPATFTPTAPAGFVVPSGASCTRPTGVLAVRVAPYVLTCTGPASGGNFNYIYVDGSLTVTPEPVVVTGPAISAVFGAAIASSYAPTVPAGFTLPTGAACASPAGPFTVAGSPYVLTCTGPATQTNFSYTYVNGSLTITPAPVTVTGPVVSIQFGNPVPSTFAPTVPAGFTMPRGATCTPPAGPYTVAGSPYVLTCTGPATEGNYAYSYVNGSLTITAEPVVVTGPITSIQYGSTVPASFAPSVPAGFTVPLGATCTTAAGPYTVAGSPYKLTCTGPAAAGNFSYSYVNGSLTITPEPVVVTGPTRSIAYGRPVASSFAPTVPAGFTVPRGATCTPPAGPYTVAGSPYVLTCTGPAAAGNFSYTYVNGSLTITKAFPSLTTTPSPSVPAGGLISDSATISGTGAASGVVTFTLYAPGDLTCATPIAMRFGTLASNAAVSGTVASTQPGTYLWEANYPGDANDHAAGSGCGLEQVVVTPQTLTGRAYGLGLTSSLLGSPLINIAPIADTGAINTDTSSNTPTCVIPLLSLLGVVTTADICGDVLTYAGYPALSTALAQTASAGVGLTGIPAISVTAVQAISATSCAGSSAVTTIALLKIGNTIVIGTPTTFRTTKTINVGVVKIVVNEVVPFSKNGDTGQTVNAIHITVNAAGLAKVDLIISSAESDIANCP